MRAPAPTPYPRAAAAEVTALPRPRRLLRLDVALRALTLTAAAAALAVAGWLYVFHGSWVLERLAHPEQWAHADFDTFWLSAVALTEGRDVYDTGAGLPNLNPPAFVAATAPYGLMDFWVAYRLWTLVSVALLVGSLLVVARELRIRAVPAGAVLVAVLLSSPAVSTFGLGQMYPALTAGLVAAWLLERRGQHAVAGVALGLVVALKPSLAPLLLVPLVRRRWDEVAAGVVTGALATVVGWVAAGAGSLPGWVQLVREHPTQTWWDNASFVGAFTRLTTASEHGRPLVEVPGGTVAAYVCGVVVVAVTAWVCRRSPAGPDTALWAMAAASLLASPIAWHNYLVVLAPALLVLTAVGTWPIVALLASLAMIGNEWPGWWFGADGSASAVPLSLYCAVLLGYWAAFTTWRSRPRGAVVSPRVPAPREAELASA